MAPFAIEKGQPFWLRGPTVGVVVLALALLKLYVASQSGLSYDEAYYTMWSMHLAPGYLDHPPVVALLIAFGRDLFGNNSLGVRLGAVLCVVASSGALYRIGTLLTDRKTAGLAVILYNLSLAGGLGFIMTPDPPSTLCWTLVLWALAEFIASKNPNWWLAVGLFAGAGLMSKYTDAFLGPGLLALALSSRERAKWLLTWQLWAGVVVLLIVVSPNIWWNYHHAWASVLFQGKRTVSHGLDPRFLANLEELVAGQMLFAGPVVVVLTGLGIARFLRWPGDPEKAGLAPLIWTSLPLLAYFVYHTLHARVDANWLSPVWPGLTLVAAWVGLNIRSRWLRAGVLGLQIALGVGLIGVVNAQVLFQPFDNPRIDRTREMRGWTQLRAEIAAVAKANGARWIATTGSYEVTGELATYGLFAGDALVVRQIDAPWRYTYLTPIRPGTMAWPALLVRRAAGGKIGKDGRLFGSVTPLGEVRRHHGKEEMEAYSLFLVSQPTPAFFAGLARNGL